eukprot:4962428-Amphidinium_carterae.1
MLLNIQGETTEVLFRSDGLTSCTSLESHQGQGSSPFGPPPSYSRPPFGSSDPLFGQMEPSGNQQGYASTEPPPGVQLSLT